MDTIAIIDFGGQYSHLIGRRIRETGVYAKVLPASVRREDLEKIDELKGIVFSGGAGSVYDDGAPFPQDGIFDMDIPFLGICYGHQIIAHLSGGEVTKGDVGEYGTTDLSLVQDNSRLFNGFTGNEEVWMNHKDTVMSVPENFSVLAKTSASPVAAFASKKAGLYGVQFHPEVTHRQGYACAEELRTKDLQCQKGVGPGKYPR